MPFYGNWHCDRAVSLAVDVPGTLEKNYMNDKSKCYSAIGNFITVTYPWDECKKS